MVQKCKKCGEPIVRWPLWKTNDDGSRKFIWINLFKMDMASLMLLLTVLGLFIGYNLDIAKCNDAIKYPCKFCDYSGCCRNVFMDQINDNESIFNSNYNISIPYSS